MWCATFAVFTFTFNSIENEIPFVGAEIWKCDHRMAEYFWRDADLCVGHIFSLKEKYDMFIDTDLLDE